MDDLLLVRFNLKKQDIISVVLSLYTDQQLTYLSTTICIFSDTRISQLESYILAPPTLRLEFNKFLNVSELVLAANF